MNAGINTGLEGVVVGETALSHVEGDIGRLSYRGQSIEALAEQPLASVLYRLIEGEHLSASQSSELDVWLAAESQLSTHEQQLLIALPRDTHPMRVLQGLTPLVSVEPQAPVPAWLKESLVEPLVLASKLSGLTRSWYSLMHTGSLVKVPDDQSFVGGLLFAFNQSAPSEAALAALNTTQILQLDHGFNAGTFAGRVVASTAATLPASISASLGALSGALHGGADEAALIMAQHIGAPEKAEAWVNQALASKTKIMGMGHREYKRLDPRAAILKPMAQQFCQGTEHEALFETLAAVEAACQAEFSKKGKEIHANLEFYKGAVYLALGIPPQFFTALFACARVFGWIAHYQEFQQSPRLIRPQAAYVGE